MKAFQRILVASFTMLRRNRILIVSSLGLGIISILVFGWLFGGNGNLSLQFGIVNQDQSPAGAQIVSQLQHSQGITAHIGALDSQLSALRDGNRDVVLVIPATYGADMKAGRAQLQVYYNQSNATTLAYAKNAVTSIVTGINEAATGQAPLVTLSEQAVSVHQLRSIDFLTPGMLGMMLMWANLSVGVALVGWRNLGILKRLAATPLRPGTLISGQMIARLVLSLAQAALLLVVAMLLFKVQVIGSWLVLALVVLVGAMAMMSLGFVVGSFAKDQDVAQSIFFLISFPMMFLGGSYFSTDGAPQALQPVINALPLTHLNDALRQIINNGASLATVQTDLLILAAWAIVGLALSARAFRWS
jgi:ABC-2 type transport system permease protein